MLRKYSYLLALSRERHFGRAAETCNISQPALSNAIRQLERDLNVPIVERGQKFQGFTDEGNVILEHARRMLGEQDVLIQSLNNGALNLSGEAKIGVIPTAMPAAARLLGPFSERHPHVHITVRSMSSRDILLKLSEFELDVGMTYINNEPLSGLRTAPMYTEDYFFLTRRTPEIQNLTSMSWERAAHFSLCLLTPDMQNRRITDAAFEAAGARAKPGIETNSLMNLYTLTCCGPWSSIVTDQILSLVKPDPQLIALPLINPQVRYAVGLVYADRNPLSRLVNALVNAASSLNKTNQSAQN